VETETGFAEPNPNEEAREEEEMQNEYDQRDDATEASHHHSSASERDDGKLKFVKVPGVRRALIDYPSFEALFKVDTPDA